MNDPDVEKAAVKIQAGFKGFKARQEIKDLKVRKETERLFCRFIKEQERNVCLCI